MILHLAVLIQICILIRQDNKNVLNRRDLIGLVDQTAIGRPVRLPAFFTSARWGCFLAKKQCCWRQFCIVVWRAAHAARGEDDQCAGVLWGWAQVHPFGRQNTRPARWSAWRALCELCRVLLMFRSLCGGESRRGSGPGKQPLQRAMPCRAHVAFKYINGLGRVEQVALKHLAAKVL